MSEAAVRRYGNLRRPKRPGLLGFGTLATGIGFFGVFAGLLLGLRFGPIAVVAVLVATLVALVPSRRSLRDGRSGYERLGGRLLTGLRRRQGHAVLLQGAAGFTPDGQCRLPGLLAASELWDVQDPYGSPFGVLVVPSTGHYTVVIECAATGQDLVDRADIDRQVDQWGGFLALLGDYGDVDGVQVVVETAPDTGVRLRQAVTSRRAENGPPFARDVMDAVVEAYPVGSASIVTRCAITFTAADKALRKGGGKHKREEMFGTIANRLPTILAQLRVSGAGASAAVMQSQDLIDAVRVAFDPMVAQDVEEARRQGGTGLAWSDAGPTRLRPYDDRLHHDRAWSKSWHMLEPPSGSFGSDQLSRLLGPHPDILRKRVALLFRPHDQISAAVEVERDIDAVTFSASAQRRVTSRTARDMVAARQTADEEAAGAGLVRFGMILTITVDSPDKLDKAESAFQQLKASARLRIRPAVGNQEVAFTGSLPCGLVLPEHMRVPDAMQDYL